MDNNRLQSQVLGLQPSDTHPPTLEAVLPSQIESSRSPCPQPLSSFEMLGFSDPGFGFSSDLNYTLLKSLLILPHGLAASFYKWRNKEQESSLRVQYHTWLYDDGGRVKQDTESNLESVPWNAVGILPQWQMTMWKVLMRSITYVPQRQNYAHYLMHKAQAGISHSA